MDGLAVSQRYVGEESYFGRIIGAGVHKTDHITTRYRFCLTIISHE